MPRGLKVTPRKEALDLQIPRHSLAHFCCAKFCLSKIRLFLISLPSSPLEPKRSRVGAIKSPLDRSHMLVGFGPIGVYFDPGSPCDYFSPDFKLFSDPLGDPPPKSSAGGHTP